MNAPKKITLFRLALVCFLILLFLGLDYVGGFVDHTAIVRESSRSFRSEVAPLFLKTRQLIPNINHEYRVAERRDPEFPGRDDDPRRFRTDSAGTIIGSEPREQSRQFNSTYILFLGGSTTESNEVDEPFRFPALVGQMLSTELGRPFVGLNLGVRANTSRDSINLVLNHPVTRKAAYIVMMHNINDRLLLALNGSYDARLVDVGVGTWPAVVDEARVLLNVFWDFISYRSNILFLLRYRFLEANPFTGERPPTVVDNRAIDYTDKDLEKHGEMFRESIALFVTLTRSMRKTPILMTQIVGQSSLQQGYFNDIIRAVAKETNTMLIDLDVLLTGQRRLMFLIDDIHFNNVGSRLAADVIAAQLGPFFAVRRQESAIGHKVDSGIQARTAPVEIRKNNHPM